MKRLLSLAFVATMLVAAAPVTHAGQQAPVPVVIDKKYRSFYGSVGTARNSNDFNQRLSCEVHGSASGMSVACTATDSANNYAFCFSSNPNIVKAVQSVQGDSFLYIFYDATGQCMDVSTYVDSAMEPKAH